MFRLFTERILKAIGIGQGTGTKEVKIKKNLKECMADR